MEYLANAGQTYMPFQENTRIPTLPYEPLPRPEPPLPAPVLNAAAPPTRRDVGVSGLNSVEVIHRQHPVAGRAAHPGARRAGRVRRHPESGTVPEGALPCRRSGPGPRRGIGDLALVAGAAVEQGTQPRLNRVPVWTTRVR